MNMPLPFPLQLSQSQRFTVPQVLRRALLCCVAAFAGALLLWVFSNVWHTEAETKRNDARASTQKTAMQLASAREVAYTRSARAKRFAPIKAALESTPPGKTEWEQLSGQLSAHPHIVEPGLDALPAQTEFPSPEHLPAITFQRVSIEAKLLHEEALLALDTIASSASAHVVPTGCSLRREAGVEPITLWAHCEFDWFAPLPSDLSRPRPAPATFDGRVFFSSAERRALEIKPTVPVIPIPEQVATPRRFDGTLWRDGRIVALWFDGDPVDPATEPTIRIGDGIPVTTVSGRQQTLSPGQSLSIPGRKPEP